MPRKLYVVYRGRSPGVYDNRPTAQAQVVGFEGNTYMGFDTKTKAIESWMNFLKDIELDQAACKADSHIHGVGAQSSHYEGSSSHVPPPERNNHYAGLDALAFMSNVVPLANPKMVLLHFSMVGWLLQICNALEQPHSTYHLVDVVVVGGQSYHRCQGSLQTNAFSVPLSTCISRYTPTEELTREDVALLLMRELTQRSGFQIQDYNHHILACKEEQISLLTSENQDLVNENYQLKQDIANLKNKH